MIGPGIVIMSIFHTHIVLPFAEPERYAGLPRRLREICEFERMSEVQQRKIQQERLQRILQHAYTTVPFYRKRFDEAGFHPSQARVDAPLPLPLLTRDDLRKSTADQLSTAYTQAELRTAATGGTTSTPVIFHRDIEAIRNKTALNLRLNQWAGYNPGDSVMTLWGAHRDLAMQPSWRWRLYEEVLMRRIPAPSGFINEEILERFRIRYEKKRPKVLYAYTNVLLAFAKFLKDRGINHKPQVLIATAELLSKPSRELIESVFGVRVFDHYGSRDVGMIASECSAHQGLHFHPWSTYIELEKIGDTPEGTAYRLVVTDLLNYGQPFIRYDTCDCVTLAESACSCGCRFPFIKQILGRAADGILLPDGGIVPGTAVATQMGVISDKLRTISEVQFVQKTYEHLHLRFVVNGNANTASQELRSICDGIETLTKHKMHWTLEQVPAIPREASGKVRLCLSELTSSNHAFEKALQTVD